MALTATSTPKIKDDIMTVLQLSTDDTDIISKSADRENIFICCLKKETSGYEKELRWLIEHIKSNGKLSRKIIVYCRSIDTVSEIFITLKESLGKYAYADQEIDSSHLLIEMYHKCTHDSSKQRILQDFAQGSSTIRCLIATVALGMGIDIPDIDIIVHIGCPKSIIQYWQEAGRCARDGRQGLSLIIYDNFTASLKTTNRDIADIVRNINNLCFRKQILNALSVSGQQELNTSVCKGCQITPCGCPSCKCCAVCAKKCPCADRGVLGADILSATQ
jgi:ATP-dependent DNA helicase RecQ